ncbi:MAG TPA: hypothetical protein VGP07_09675 [Polyangia bacterium]|jgi:hypothetical protein
MTRLPLFRIAFTVALLALCGGRARAAGALTLDPFRPTTGSPQRLALDPVQPAGDAKSENVVVPSPASHAPAAIACQDDAECPDENICEQAVCQRIQQRVNVLYLYYQEGAFRELLGLYWAKRGPTGFTVLAPFYWHFFAPRSRSRVVAPFYWHFEDDVAQRTSTVIVPGLPISWSREPGARSFGIWPLFYRSTKFGWAAPLLGSFDVADPDHGQSFGALGFLYWWSHAPKSRTDLLFPVFYYKRSPESAFGFALPLNFYWRTDVESHTLAIPLFLGHAWKNGSSVYSWLGYRTRQGRNSNGSLLWLYWGGRTGESDDAYDVLFPLLWSFRSPKSATTIVAPLVFSFRRDDGWLNTVLPLWWTGGNSTKGWRFQTLLPFFYWAEGDHGAKFSWLTPLGGYGRDRDAQSRTLFLLPAPLLYRRDPTTAIDLVTPLYLRYTDRPTDSTTHLISLLLYRNSAPAGTSTVLFPIFWRFHDVASGRATTAVLPFFFHREAPRDRLTAGGIFPLWGYHRSFADGGWSAGLFPLAFFGHRPSGGHAVVFPLFWHLSDAKGSTTVLAPLFFSSHDRHGYDAGVLPLLTFFGRRDATSYQVQFPLFWRFANAETGTSTAVTPLGFYGSSPEGWRLGVGPLLPIIWAAGGGPRGHFVLFPIVWHFRDDQADKTTTVVANYLHRRHGDETTDALFPLFYYRRGAKPGGSDETSFTLFPLVHYRRDATTRVLVTPLGASLAGPERQGGFVGPYFWYHGKTFTARGVPGLYADVTRADTQERTRQWGPLFAMDAPGRSARILVPLFGRYQDAQETDTYVFPTFFRQRKADGYEVDAFLPLYWRSKWQDRTTTVVGPFYDRDGGGVHDTGLAPFYFWAKNGDRTMLVIPPLLTIHRHDFRAGTSVTWAGLFFKSHSEKQDTTVLFPLFWSGRDGDRTHQMLFPLYWHFQDGAASRSTLAVLLYWSTRGTTRLRALLPIAWYTRDDVQHTGSEALLPLFYAAHGPQRFTLFTLLAGWSRSVDTRRFYVGPLYVSDTVESSTRLLFPLYVSHLNRKTETRTRFILPLLYFSRGSPEKGISTVAGLFWRRRDISSATTLFFPLFIDVHDFRQSRTTVVLPLFVRHANEVTGESLWLTPLYYRHVTAEDTTNVVFPLFWDFKHNARRTTVLFPFFAHWTRATYAGTYVFPNIYYRKGITAGEADGTWRLFIPPLFDAAVVRPGDFRWEILGGLFGKERIGRNHYLKLFFFTFETQKASAVQTSWYGQPTRPSRVRPARGLATNGW